jgi:hypothetical protein
VEVAALDDRHLAGAAPFALVVGVVDAVVGTDRDAARRPEPRGLGMHDAVGADPHRPASPVLRPEGFGTERSVEREPEIAVGLEDRTEAVLVVVAADRPVVADRLQSIGVAVAVEVGHLRDLTALRDEDRTVPAGARRDRGVTRLGVGGRRRKTERLLQTVGEEVVSHAMRICGGFGVGRGPREHRDRLLRVHRVLDDPHLATTGARHDLATAERQDAADLEMHALRLGKGADGPVVVLIRGQRGRREQHGHGERDDMLHQRTSITRNASTIRTHASPSSTTPVPPRTRPRMPRRRDRPSAAGP